MEYVGLTEVFALVIVVLSILITRYLIPWLKNKINEMGNDELNFWLDFFVKAAEEKYKDVAAAGSIKFDYVKKMLIEKGFTFDEETLSALIDGKVRELFNWDDYPAKVGGTE